MAHDHAAQAHGNRRRLTVALAIVVVVLLIELLGAWLSGSLALLADAGHMTSDAIGLVVALVASAIAATGTLLDSAGSKCSVLSSTAPCSRSLRSR
jgi:cobalt-zinc-cadmium efflux system protein